MEPLLDKEVQACRSSKRRHLDGLRRLWQQVVRTSCTRATEELTGGLVVGFISDDHITPEIAAGVLMLEPVGADAVAQPAIAVVDRAPG